MCKGRCKRHLCAAPVTGDPRASARRREGEAACMKVIGQQSRTGDPSARRMRCSVVQRASGSWGKRTLIITENNGVQLALLNVQNRAFSPCLAAMQRVPIPVTKRQGGPCLGDEFIDGALRGNDVQTAQVGHRPKRIHPQQFDLPQVGCHNVDACMRRTRNVGRWDLD
jgi:hypothetical protein